MGGLEWGLGRVLITKWHPSSPVVAELQSDLGEAVHPRSAGVDYCYSCAISNTAVVPLLGQKSNSNPEGELTLPFGETPARWFCAWSLMDYPFPWVSHGYMETHDAGAPKEPLPPCVSSLMACSLWSSGRQTLWWPLRAPERHVQGETAAV